MATPPPSLLPLIDRAFQAVHDEDAGLFRQSIMPVLNEAKQSPPQLLTEGIERIAPVLPGLTGVFAKLGVIAGALVEAGGSPVPLAGVLPQPAAESMAACAVFAPVWARATGDQPLPTPGEGPTPLEVRLMLAQEAARSGLSEAELARVVAAWFGLGDVLLPMITAMGHREFRAAVSPADLARVQETAAAIADREQNAQWVLGLSLVLDDEPLIVLDPATERGWALTMGGVGDNFQLHTLLADRLIGDPAQGLLAGERPAPAWVRAATDAFPQVAADDPVLRRFQLHDGHGSYVYAEGRPADIRPLDGTRVLVVRPERGRFGWGVGRVYMNMAPSLTLDRTLAADEAAGWLARITPGKER